MDFFSEALSGRPATLAKMAQLEEQSCLQEKRKKQLNTQ